REGVRAARPDGDEPVPPDAGAAEGARDRVASGDARRGDRRARRLGAGEEGPRPAHLRPLRRAQAQGVGRLPRPTHRLGAGAVPGSALAEKVGPSDAASSASPVTAGGAVCLPRSTGTSSDLFTSGASTKIKSSPVLVALAGGKDP